MALGARHWLLLSALFVVALAVRLPLLPAAVAGDEAAHYFVARTLGADPSNVQPLYPSDAFLSHDYVEDPTPLFWARPLFSVLLAPAAQISFEAYRVFHMAAASLIPVVLVLVLRDLRVSPFLAYASGLAVALHPNFVLFSALVFPDMLLALFVLLAIWADVRERPVLAALAALAAMWCKETGFVALVVLFGLAVWRGRRSNRLTLWPLRLDRAASGYLAAWCVAWLPLLYTFRLGGIFPGWGQGGDLGVILERLPLSLLLVPLVLWGLVWSRTRPWALLAAAYLAFHLAYRLFLDGGVAAWHFPVPSLLVLLAAAVVLDEWLRRARLVPRVAGALVAIVLVVIVAVPMASPVKREAYPLSHVAEFSLGEAMDFASWEEWDIETIREALPPDRPLFLVDVDWFHALYPFSDVAPSVTYVYTGIVPASPDDARLYAEAAERPGVLTLVRVGSHAFNEGLRTVYADCSLAAAGRFVLLDTAACAGRTDELRAEFARRIGWD